MANRPTMQDVARAAGVSATTVDRAINGRATVRPETLRKIAEAAHQVGYHGKGLFRDRIEAGRQEMRFGFVLLKQSQEFYRNYAREIEEAVAARTDIRGEAVIHYASSQSPAEFATILRELGETCHAVGGGALNDRRLDPIVEDLQAKGIAVFAMLNDFAQAARRCYIGLNNMKIGRVAAWQLTKVIHSPGKLAIFVGGNRWHGHDLREVGFRTLVRETERGFTVLDALVNLETRQLTYEATLDLLDRHPDLKGIYVAGGGMEGAIAALRELHPKPQVALVVNEVTAESRRGLIEGYVTMAIRTPLGELSRDTVDMMVRAAQGQDQAIPERKFLQPALILPEIL